MIDGAPLIDAHVHAVRLPTIKRSWKEWADRYGTPGLYDLYDDSGTIVPQLFDEYMENGSGHWFARQHADELDGPVAYFCAEYGLN